MITQHAYAKINLALHVTGQREDGYHLIDSLVTFANFGDTLTFEPANDLSLYLDGPYGSLLSQSPSDDANNLVMRAAQALRQFAHVETSGAVIRLTKNLPVASGIGGGSADAAATLLGLSKLWALSISDSDLGAIALSLGADVPMCLTSQSLRARQIGDEVDPINLPSFPIVLTNPGLEVSTPDIFEKLQTKTNAPIGDLPKTKDRLSWLEALRHMRNDLQIPAMQQAPEIANCLAMLECSGASFVRMSGSGATCFGLYDTDDEAQRAAKAIGLAAPDWWVKTGQTH